MPATNLEVRAQCLEDAAKRLVVLLKNDCPEPRQVEYAVSEIVAQADRYRTTYESEAGESL